MNSNIKYWTSERFFKRLDYFLDSNDITLCQLSQLAETSTSSIYQIRRRKALPNFQTLCAICDALDLKLWEFFDCDYERTPEMEQVIFAMQDVPKDGQKILAQLVQYMKK